MAEPTPSGPTGTAPAAPGPQVPYRVILATIGLVLATYVGFETLVALQRVLTWLVVAGFFAIVLNPAVDFLVYRAKIRRTLAALLVFLVGVASVGGLLYLFIRPVVDEASTFADRFPHYVAEAKAGKGPVGHLVKKYKIDEWVQRNQAKLKKALQDAGKKAIPIARKVGNTVAALATILVLTYLLLVEGPRVMAGGVGMLSPPHQNQLKRIGRDASRAVTGYMAGNLLISVIAGIVTYCGLWAFGVPFRTVMAIWVGFADLIPLVGATLGAIPTVLVALLHSPTAAIGMIIIYVVYQQFENHVLQVGIMARTVRLSPLAVLVSLIAGVELAGLLGALLAIPLAGIIQVVAKDVYHDRRRRRAGAPESEPAAESGAATEGLAAAEGLPAPEAVGPGATGSVNGAGNGSGTADHPAPAPTQEP